MDTQSTAEPPELGALFDGFPIVGIGASAGGLASLETLFENLPEDTGMVFVVVQHLSPDFKSLMSEILSRHTVMPVTMATEEMALEADHVYVIPPGKELRCFGSTLAISDLPPGLNRPIDTFFESLATNQGVPAVGIILSGTGSDGSNGIQAIHSTGGLTITESCETAQFDGMPLSAERTGCVDLVLRPSEIPAALRRYHENQNSVQGLAEVADLRGTRLIFSLLQKRYGLQFEQYKPSTIGRRIERRQALLQFDTIVQYAEYLETNPQELDSLFHDLLIGVTKFFRDDQAYQSLRETLLQEIEPLADDQTFRVWTAGCATGEEPYSIAMIVDEIYEELGRKPDFKVFATDVHQGSLDRAAKGEFTAEVMDYMSAEQREKYFDRLESGRFRVRPSLRGHLVFAIHNVIEDAPFTNIHLVACRNALIYFRRAAQDAAIASLHFSLVQDGILFLGPSEALGDLSPEFDTIDRKWRIFRKIRNRRELISQVVRFREMQTVQADSKLTPADAAMPLNVNGILDIYDALLQTRVSLGLLLDRNQSLIHAIGSVSQILKGASGRFTGMIGDFLEAPARTTVVAALIRSQKQPGTNFILENVQPDGDRPETYHVSVMALENPNGAKLGWIVQFELSDNLPPSSVRVSGTRDETYELLESELQFTRESLSASVEQMEASNEELQATNEELQSTNEELHSVNEELHSVNAELNRKVFELEESTNDLETLLLSSDVGTIFLDVDLRIRKFTESVLRYFSLVPHDIGRPLSDFTNRIGVDNLNELLQEVLRSEKICAIDGVDDYGDPLFIKIVPYQIGSVVRGAVITLVHRSKVNPEQVRGAIGAWDWPDVSSDQMWWSPACYQLIGIDLNEPASLAAWRDRIHPDDMWQLSGPQGIPCHFAATGCMRIRMLCEDGEFRKFNYQTVSRITEDGKILSMSGIITTSQIVRPENTEVANSEELLKRDRQDFQDFAHALTLSLDTPLREIRSNVGLLGEDNQHDQAETAAIQSVIADRTEHLESMFARVLEYARVHTEGNEMRPCDCNVIMDDVLDQFNDVIDESKAEIRREQLPRVLGDADQIKRLFWYLMDNALKYRGDAIPEIHIQASPSQVTNQSVISISDNGVGISHQDLREIFVIFKRLPSSQIVPGAGVGLSICERIAQRHGGKIWCESQLDGGSRFCVSLPVVKEPHS